MSSRVTGAAKLLIEARCSGVTFAEFPDDLLPQSVEDAYGIQDIVGKEFGFYGWKLGPLKDGVEPRCSLLPGKAALESSADPVKSPVGTDGIELEVAVKIGKDLPKIDRPYTVDDAREAIGSLHLILELIGSRFNDRGAVSPFSAIADCQNNEAVVIGPALPDWQTVDLSSLALSLSVDGKEPFVVETGPDLDSILAQLVWLANHTAERTGGLRAGDLVITGARIGPVPGKGARRITGEGAPFAPVTLVL